MKFPKNITLKELNKEDFDLSEFASEHDCVIFIYPKMGDSGKLLSAELKAMDGMTGCTLQTKGYEAKKDEFAKLGYAIIAVGTHASLEEQAEFKSSVGAEYKFLDDSRFALENALNLPTFTTGDGRKFYFRHTLIVRSGQIISSYKVAKPADDAQNVLEFISGYSEGRF